MVSLTECAVRNMLSSSTDSVLQEGNPILQVVTIKELQGNRYRLFLNDGQYATGACMLASQLNSMVTDKTIHEHCIIKVSKYICNTVKNTKKIIVLLEMEVIKKGSEVNGKIGNPQSLNGSEDLENHTSNTVSAKASAVPEKNTTAPLSSFNHSSSGPASVSSPMAKGQSMGSANTNCHPISSLTPYQNKWTIRARITNKSDIRHYSNARGEGKLFSVQLLDKDGEIKATGFNQECDRFYDMLEVDKVYFVSQGQLKPANKQYNKLNHDYEMSFSSNTQITFCQENTDIPVMQFEFKSINNIEQIDKDEIIDVIGICKSCDEVATIVSKNTQKEFQKRDLQIIDDSGSEIRLTLWGSQATNFDGSENPILAVKGAKVSDFNGKSLSVLSSATIQTNPDIPESHKLRAWFEQEGCNMTTNNLSSKMGGFSGVSNLKSIGDAMNENLGSSGTADFYSVKACPTFIKKENCMYTACPTDGCNKKVIDMNNGTYRCEKCCKEFESFNYRLMISVCIADSTNSVWATVFNDQAETLLGVSAKELGSLREMDNDRFLEILTQATFKEFIFKLRVQMQTYNEESRIKTSVQSIQEVNHSEYQTFLINEIKAMGGINI